MRDITWRKKKLPSGDEVEVTTWSGAGFVALNEGHILAAFRPRDSAVPVGKHFAYNVAALAAAVNEAIKTEYADSGEARAASLAVAAKDVAKLVEVTAPKSKAAKAPRSGFLFALPEKDPEAVRRKEAKLAARRGEREQAAVQAKRMASGRR